MDLTLSIDRRREEPVYEQVAGQVRQLVASGALVPGTTMPSVRRLARDLGVSLNTIARAYRLLEAEGFVVIRDRAGATIAKPAGVDQSVRAKLLDHLRTTLARLRQTGMATEELLHAIRIEVEALGRPPEEKKND